MESTEAGIFRLGIKDDRIKQLYSKSHNQFSICERELISFEKVPNIHNASIYCKSSKLRHWTRMRRFRIEGRKNSLEGLKLIRILSVRAGVANPWHSGAVTVVRKDMFICRNCGGGDRGRVAIYRPFGEVSLSLNRTVTCMVLKANDRRTSCPCHDEFRGPRSDYVRQVALATTT
ncbi:uncharacterized protein TNCV_3402321 [Trichonephila clavipes]|nr:uncharacterized protein TNCV_3402321 [Trichonephila clavipes]